MEVVEKIPVNEPLLTGNEKRYLIECIDTGWVGSEGPFVKLFEEKFAARVGRDFAVTVTNGTAALELAVAALGIEAGDEVIMPTFTIISCARAVIQAGAVPVLVDSERLTWNMNVEAVESNITSKTKAIMVVHTYGLPVDMEPILFLAEKHGLRVIEDAAEMHGQTYKGRPCGSFGELSIFSFYPNKHLTTGEGGMITTDDPVLAARLRSMRNLCFQADRRFVHEELGGNYRMTNLQAAVGLAQLERLDEFVDKKRRMGRLYTEGLETSEKFQLPLCQTSYAENIYWVYGVVLSDEGDAGAETYRDGLEEMGIQTRPFFWPMHEQPVFERMGLFRRERYPVAEMLARRGFYLPSGLGLADGQIRAVAAALLGL